MKINNEDTEYRKVLKDFFDEIIDLYKHCKYEKPILLYDVAEKDITAWPYEKFKSVLFSEESQMLLEKGYRKSLLANKILIVVSDSIRQIIKTCAIDKTSQHQIDVAECKLIY